MAFLSMVFYIFLEKKIEKNVSYDFLKLMGSKRPGGETSGGRNRRWVKLPRGETSEGRKVREYIRTGSFTHSALVKATVSALIWAVHCKGSKKSWYYHTFIRTFCNKMFGKNHLESLSHSALVKATGSALTWAGHRKGSEKPSY